MARDDGETQLLLAWEYGANAGPPLRGAAMLAASGLDRPDQAWPLARIERALVRQRQAWFGPAVSMLATCPGCRTQYELRVDLDALDAGDELSGPVRVLHDGLVVEVRPPCSADLVALAHLRTADDFAAALFERCTALQGAEERAVGDLPPEVRAAAAAALAQGGHGPRLAELSCGACGSSWQALIDIADILWAETDARARRVLHEVHELAMRLHWSEHDILALSPARRAVYLGASG